MQPHIAVSVGLKVLGAMFSAHSFDLDDVALNRLCRMADSELKVRHQVSSLSIYSCNVAEKYVKTTSSEDASCGCCRDCRKKEGNQAWCDIEK